MGKAKSVKKQKKSEKIGGFLKENRKKFGAFADSHFENMRV